MDITVEQQLLVFVLSVALGAGIGVLYDLFRILRLAIRFGPVWVFIQDFLFWLCAALITFMFVFTMNNGEVRWYIFMGACIGALLYFATLGKLLLRSADMIIRACRRLLRGLRDLIMLPFVVLGMNVRPKRIQASRNRQRSKKSLAKDYAKPKKQYTIEYKLKVLETRNTSGRRRRE